MAKHRLDRATVVTARPAPKHRATSEPRFNFNFHDLLPSRQTVNRVSRFVGKAAVAAGIFGGVLLGAERVHEGLTVDKSNVVAESSVGNAVYVGNKSQAELSNEQIMEGFKEAVHEGQEAFIDTSIGIGSITASSLAGAGIIFSRRRRLEGVTEEDRAFEVMFEPVLDPIEEETDLATQLLGPFPEPDIDFEAGLLVLDQQFVGANA
jgi:hypothetical protein